MQSPVMNGTNAVFQFTTSQGGRRLEWHRFEDAQSLSIHDLTRRSTGRLTANSAAIAFQFTTSQGGRHLGPFPV